MNYKVNYLDMHNTTWRHVIITQTQLLRGNLLAEIAKESGRQERYVCIYKIEAITEA